MAFLAFRNCLVYCRGAKNCYGYDTVVFTHHGLDGVNTPMGTTASCTYKSGSWKSKEGSLIWNPEKTHQCAYVPIEKWNGDYARGFGYLKVTTSRYLLRT